MIFRVSLPRLQQQHVHSTLNQPGGLDVIAVNQLIEGDAASYGDGLCRGTHGTGDEPGFFRSCCAAGHFARQFGRYAIKSAGLGGQVVLCQHDRGGAEGVGLYDVRAGVKVSSMDRLDHVRAGEDQVFVASLVIETAKVVGAEIVGLNCRAHRAVNHQNAFMQRRFQG